MLAELANTKNMSGEDRGLEDVEFVSKQRQAQMMIARTIKGWDAVRVIHRR